MKHLASQSLILWSCILMICLSSAPRAHAENPPAAAQFPQPAPQRITIKIWHDQDSVVTHWLQEVWKRFNHSDRGTDVALEVDNKADFEPALYREEDGLDKDRPDALILPNDLIGLHRDFKLSEVPPETARGIKRRFLNTVREKRHLYGVPLLVSDVLLLYYNKKIVSRPIDDLDRLKAMRSADSRFAPISWPFGLPRYFAPFLVATGAWPGRRQQIRFDRPEFDEAFNTYKEMAKSDVVDPDCDASCALDSFLHGNSAYAIGPVSELFQAREALKKDLGVAPLPLIHKRPVRPLYRILALVFPFHSLKGAKRSRLLAFAKALAGKESQLLLGREWGRVPTNSSAFETLARRAEPEMKVAIQQVRHALPVPSRIEMLSFWSTLSETLKLITQPEPGLEVHEPGKLAEQLFMGYQSRFADHLKERE